MIYLLDTNVCVQYLRGRNQSVLMRLRATPAQSVRLCSVVVTELLLGALRSAKPEENRTKVNEFRRPYMALPFDETAAEIHAEIRYQLETAGTPIGPHDFQIAAIALANGLTLVTHNTAEFSRVPGLRIEDWENP